MRRQPAVLLLVLVAAALAGCSSTGTCYANRTPPRDLPTEPEPGAEYCRVWVPPVYRKVPRLRMVRPACTREVCETGIETRYQEVCTKPRETEVLCKPGLRCNQSVVQTHPGGWKWKQEPDGCWKYAYEPACYQWCEREVTEDGITYCSERPPEYGVEAVQQRVARTRTVYVPAEYETVWEDEVYIPGHWAWQGHQTCEATRPCACPTLPRQEMPCRPATGGVTGGCPRVN